MGHARGCPCRTAQHSCAAAACCCASTVRCDNLPGSMLCCGISSCGRANLGMFNLQCSTAPPARPQPAAPAGLNVDQSASTAPGSAARALRPTASGARCHSRAPTTEACAVRWDQTVCNRCKGDHCCRSIVGGFLRLSFTVPSPLCQQSILFLLDEPNALTHGATEQPCLCSLSGRVNGRPWRPRTGDASWTARPFWHAV